MKGTQRTPNDAAPMPDALDTARTCALIADEKKAQEIVILDLRRFTYVTDFFVIATATSARQMQAIGHAIQEAMRARGVRPLGAEGAPTSRWVLLDYGEVVVHLFDPQWRRLYDLELLWGDAPRVPWSDAK